jgi:hypothetical protein
MCRLSLITALLLSAATLPFAHAIGTDHMNHGMHAGQHGETANEVTAPTEQGQSAFAAIAEIVALLQNDPNTDWSKVNINALREHLQDMQLVTLQSDVQTNVQNNEVVFDVSGTGRTLSAIQAMVPAHAGVLSSLNMFKIDAQNTATGAQMRVAFTNETEKQKLLALGFFGIMATGAHHQEHHLAMARGQNVHQH